MDVGVVVVGDEILAGHVQDANAHFIATRLSALGHRLRRVVVVGDVPEAIAFEVRTELAASVGMIVVCGGLGPTHDDRTMEGVADALGVPLEPCAPLMERIDALIAQADSQGFGHERFGSGTLRKMGLAPAGAEMLVTAAGILPAVVVEHAGVPVVVLPGPPGALSIVFSECVEPRYLEGTGAVTTRREIIHPFPESTVADVLGDLQRRFPTTSIGSYPQAGHSLVRIVGPAPDVDAVAADVDAFIATLSATPEGRAFIGFVEGRRRRARERKRT